MEASGPCQWIPCKEPSQLDFPPALVCPPPCHQYLASYRMNNCQEGSWVVKRGRHLLFLLWLGKRTWMQASFSRRCPIFSVTAFSPSFPNQKCRYSCDLFLVDGIHSGQECINHLLFLYYPPPFIFLMGITKGCKWIFKIVDSIIIVFLSSEKLTRRHSWSLDEKWMVMVCWWERERPSSMSLSLSGL